MNEISESTALGVLERKHYSSSFLSELKRAFWILRKKRRVHRTNNLVGSVYEDVYATLNEEYDRESRTRRYQAIYGEQLLTVDGLWFSRVYAHLIDIWIKILGGRRVLEVGSGRGNILFWLSQLNPELKLTGLEQSAQGVARSKERQKEIGGTIDFVEGDARRLPFADFSFDVAFTVHVLESMPRDYEKAVSEMARVARYGIFVEEFREAQSSIADFLWLRYKDYFRDSYRKLNAAPLYFTKDIPRKPKYGVGLYVGKFN
jgi:SAM-dependent methyltransferase